MKYIYMLLFVFLVSCVTPQKYNNLMDLKKGQDLNEDLTKYEDYMLEDLVEIDYNGSKYQVMVMMVLSSKIHIVGKNNNQSTRNGVGKTNYYLVYQNNKLINWGYGYELNRDQELAGLPNAVIDYIDEL